MYDFRTFYIVSIHMTCRVLHHDASNVPSHRDVLAQSPWRFKKTSMRIFKIAIEVLSVVYKFIKQEQASSSKELLNSP